jgi:hypothetical protein
MGQLNEDLGNAMNTQEVADYFKLDVKTVRKYYKQLGGMRLGRHYRFFEKEIYNAVQNWNEMEGPSEERWTEDGEDIQHTEGGNRLGSRDAEKTRKRLDREDRHGLFG